MSTAHRVPPMVTLCVGLFSCQCWPRYQEVENAALRFTDDEFEDQSGEAFSQDVAASQHPSWLPALKRYFLSRRGVCVTVETVLNTAVCRGRLSG